MCQIERRKPHPRITLADLELGDKVAHLAQQNLTAPNIGVDWVTGIVEDPHTNPPWVR